MSIKAFRWLVVIIVTLIGAGFGTLTGVVYSENYWWAGLIAGASSSLPLALLYIYTLKKISVRGYSKKIIWLLSTLSAIICGLICTTLAHGIMTTIIYNGRESLLRHMDGFWLLFISIGEGIGAGAGLVAGGILSLVYLKFVKGEINEVA